MPSTDLLLTFNAGSSTVKIGIFAIEDAKVRRIGKGVIDFRAAPLAFSLTEGPKTFDMSFPRTRNRSSHRRRSH